MVIGDWVESIYVFKLMFKIHVTVMSSSIQTMHERRAWWICIMMIELTEATPSPLPGLCLEMYRRLILIIFATRIGKPCEN